MFFTNQIEIIDEVDFESSQIDTIDEFDYESSQIDINEVNYESNQIDIINESESNDPNDYIKVYTHLKLDTYIDWIKNILPNISGAHYIRHTRRDNQEYELNDTYLCHCAGKPRIKTKF
ncbi:hypothetical protein C2G38_2233576, partial [Gigaspora rosea]